MMPLRYSLALLLTLALLALPSMAAALDTDGDGLRDAFEKRYGLTSFDDPDSNDDGVIDAAEDPDGDQLGNRGEQRFGLNPGVSDTDGDGTPDGREDDDGDGRSNALEQDQRPLPRGLRPVLLTAVEDVSRHAPACGVRSGDATVNHCDFGDTGSDLSVALIGDSKATMYLPPAIAAAKREGWHLTTLLKGRCSPVLGTMPRQQRRFDGGDSCRSWRIAALSWLRQHPTDLIVLVFSDDYTLVDKQDHKLVGDRKLRALTRGLAETVAALPESSKIVLLADAPKSVLNPVKCLRQNPRDMSACVTRRVPRSAKRTDAALRRAIVEAGGTYRTLKDRICPFSPCPLVQGDTLIYRDKGHLTVTFTRLLAPSLRAELAPLMPAGEDELVSVSANDVSRP